MITRKEQTLYEKWQKSKVLNIVLTIITIVSATITIYVFIKDRQYLSVKELSILPEDAFGLLNNSVSSNKLSILYDGEKVSNLYYKKYIIKNTGRIEITPEDYIENVCISFDYKILEINLEYASNDYIKTNILNNSTLTEKSICFPKILLNSEDYYILKVITEKPIANFNISAVITGVKKINIDYRNSKIVQRTNFSKEINIICNVFLSIIVLVVVIMIICYIIHKTRVKKFIKEFNCSKIVSDIYANYYYKKVRRIKKNNTMDDSEKLIKTFNRDMKKEINRILQEK